MSVATAASASSVLSVEPGAAAGVAGAVTAAVATDAVRGGPGTIDVREVGDIRATSTEPVARTSAAATATAAARRRRRARTPGTSPAISRAARRTMLPVTRVRWVA